MIRRTNNNRSDGGAGEPGTTVVQEGESSKLRENVGVNAKIDAYIQANPKEWTYIQGLPRDRLERTVVLHAVQKQERTERMRAGILKKLEENPELKEAYRTLVKNLPADQQEKAIANLAARTLRTVAPPKQQQAQGARV
jgi:hypothetical protein